jgi:hypothetical protein
MTEDDGIMSKCHSAMLCEQIAKGEVNPFWTLEAAQEHCGMLWSWYWKQGGGGGKIQNGGREIIGKTGDFDYELNVIEQYLQKVLNLVAAIAYDVYLASDGNEAAQIRVQAQMEEAAQINQARWDMYHE